MSSDQTTPIDEERKKLSVVLEASSREEGCDVNARPTGDGFVEREQPIARNIASNSTNSPEFPRLILRNLPFSQSRNRVRIEHNQGIKIFSLLRYDWFHVFLRIPTGHSFMLMITVWTIVLVIFARLYVWSDASTPNPDCRLGPSGPVRLPIKFRGAFAFSLQTCTTGTIKHGFNCMVLDLILSKYFIWAGFSRAKKTRSDFCSHLTHCNSLSLPSSWFYTT